MMSGLSRLSLSDKKSSGNELFRLLECPICSETLLPPIFNCTNGHSICNDCRPQMTKCAMCNGQLTNIRCITLESIVSNTKFKCKFLTEGCTKVVNGDVLRDHYEVCNYRNVLCDEVKKNSCKGVEIPYKSYIEHLEKSHECYFAKSTSEEHFHIEQSLGETQLVSTDTKWPPVVKRIVKNGVERIYFFQTEIRNDMICWWLSAFDKKDESQFNFSFILYRKDSPTPKIEWQSQIFSFRDKFDDIKDHICFKLPIECLLQFTSSKVNVGKILSWNIKCTIKDASISV